MKSCPPEGKTSGPLPGVLDGEVWPIGGEAMEPETFKEYLRAWMAHHNKTRKNLSQAPGLYSTAAYRWADGHRLPSPKQLRIVCEALPGMGYDESVELMCDDAARVLREKYYRLGGSE